MKKALIYAISTACDSTSGADQIKSLKDTFKEELDLSFNNNFALRRTIEQQNYTVAAYLLTDDDVIRFESNNDFPCLRFALEKHSPIVQLFFIGFNLTDIEIEVPADLMIMVNELKQREKEKSAAPSDIAIRLTQDSTVIAPLTAYSDFQNRTNVNSNASFASAGEENRPRSSLSNRLFRFVVCG